MVGQGGSAFPKKGSFGFTLLELLVSLTILAIVASLIFGSLKVGIGAWEKGERDIDATQRLRAVAELIKAQMASAYLEKRVKLTDGVEFYVRGDKGTLEFCSVVPILPKSKGRPVYVKYRVERDEDMGEERLFLREWDLTFFGPKELQEEEEGDLTEDTLLIGSAKEISFEYLSPSEADNEQVWVEQWGEEKKFSIPLAIRLCIRLERDEAPLCIVARLPMP